MHKIVKLISIVVHKEHESVKNINIAVHSTEFRHIHFDNSMQKGSCTSKAF